MRAFKEIMEAPEYMNVMDMYSRIVDMPSERFWVSEERATLVMADIMRGRSIQSMGPNKREMFGEIYRRVQEMRREHPDWSLSEVTARVVAQPAPKFYLTPSSARVILGKIRNGWYEQRKRKYRHLFM